MPTEAQKAKAEERRARLRTLWQKVGEISEAERRAFSEKVGTVTTCDGHAISTNNSILLAYQRENVTVIGGYRQWQAHGRQVKKGESSLGIWIPRKPKEDENRPEGTISEKDLQIRFIFGSVFDISQTEPTQ